MTHIAPPISRTLEWAFDVFGYGVRLICCFPEGYSRKAFAFSTESCIDLTKDELTDLVVLSECLVVDLDPDVVREFEAIMSRGTRAIWWSRVKDCYAVAHFDAVAEWAAYLRANPNPHPWYKK